MKTFVITLSKQFPGSHPLKGTNTNFKPQFELGLKNTTIRGNYHFWKKRIDQVNAGKAVLSIRQWSGIPYYSKQEEIGRLTKVGLQQVDVEVYNEIIFITVDDKLKYMITNNIINNDGLNYLSFRDWFKKPIIGGALIHFTDLRY